MKHNYDIAHNRANGARNRYNSAKSRAARLQAQYLKSKAACGRVAREQKAARAASSGLGNLKRQPTVPPTTRGSGRLGTTTLAVKQL